MSVTAEGTRMGQEAPSPQCRADKVSVKHSPLEALMWYPGLHPRIPISSSITCLLPRKCVATARKLKMLKALRTLFNLHPQGSQIFAGGAPSARFPLQRWDPGHLVTKSTDLYPAPSGTSHDLGVCSASMNKRGQDPCSGTLRSLFSDWGGEGFKINP